MNERQLSILDKVANANCINVKELAEELNVSQVTIRTDLKQLEKKRNAGALSWRCKNRFG